LKGLGGNLKPCGVADRRFSGQGKGLPKFYAGCAQAKFGRLLDGAPGYLPPVDHAPFLKINRIVTISIIVGIIEVL